MSAVELPFYGEYCKNKPTGTIWNRDMFEDWVGTIANNILREEQALLHPHQQERFVEFLSDHCIHNPSEFERAMLFVAEEYNRANKVGSGVWLDIHSENVMYNLKNNHIVIIDPIAERATSNVLGCTSVCGCDFRELLTKEQLDKVYEIRKLLGDGIIRKDEMLLDKFKYANNTRLGSQKRKKEVDDRIVVNFSEKFDDVRLKARKNLEAIGFTYTQALAIVDPANWTLNEMDVAKVNHKLKIAKGLIKGERPQIDIFMGRKEKEEKAKQLEVRKAWQAKQFKEANSIVTALEVGSAEMPLIPARACDTVIEIKRDVDVLLNQPTRIQILKNGKVMRHMKAVDCVINGLKVKPDQFWLDEVVTVSVKPEQKSLMARIVKEQIEQMQEFMPQRREVPIFQALKHRVNPKHDDCVDADIKRFAAPVGGYGIGMGIAELKMVGVKNRVERANPFKFINDLGRALHQQKIDAIIPFDWAVEP